MKLRNDNVKKNRPVATHSSAGGAGVFTAARKKNMRAITRQTVLAPISHILVLYKRRNLLGAGVLHPSNRISYSLQGAHRGFSCSSCILLRRRGERNYCRKFRKM
jgi:hypothetical protein